jgi:hypothetical protein
MWILIIHYDVIKYISMTKNTDRAVNFWLLSSKDSFMTAVALLKDTEDVIKWLTKKMKLEE